MNFPKLPKIPAAPKLQTELLKRTIKLGVHKGFRVPEHFSPSRVFHTPSLMDPFKLPRINKIK